MHRTDVLDAAQHIISADRNRQYGEPEDCFSNIAALWSAWINARLGGTAQLDLAGHEVATLMQLFKIARRLANPGHADSWIDDAGYAACGAEIALRAAAKKTETPFPKLEKIDRGDATAGLNAFAAGAHQ